MLPNCHGQEGDNVIESFSPGQWRIPLKFHAGEVLVNLNSICGVLSLSFPYLVCRK